jgi:hypothetical protein
MRMIILDGPPEQIQQAMPHVRQLLEGHGRTIAEPATVVSDEAPSPEMYRRLLANKPLYPNQKALLRVLYLATDWIGADDLSRAMGVTRRALTGVMGGIGTRASGVRGWPRRSDTGKRPTRWLWEHERRGREDFYRLTPQFRQAIAAADILNGERRQEA